jgi:hypothetical protein
VVTVPPSQPASASAPSTKAPQKPVKHAVHHPKPENKAADRASSENAGVSAIGQLSSGEPSELRSQTQNSISSTERGLRDINRTLNDQEQKTVAQIREFLKQARTALTSGDVDGAHTLAVKAKVLLGEINQ